MSEGGWQDSEFPSRRPPAHEIAVAMMRGGGFVTNAALREWGVERHIAGAVLRDLTERGIALRQGGRRYAHYVLDPAPNPSEQPEPSASPASVDLTTALQTSSGATSTELRERTGLARSTLQYRLNKLIDAGTVRAEGPARSPNRTYRWVQENLDPGTPGGAPTP